MTAFLGPKAQRRLLVLLLEVGTKYHMVPTWYGKLTSQKFFYSTIMLLMNSSDSNVLATSSSTSPVGFVTSMG